VAQEKNRGAPEIIKNKHRDRGVCFRILYLLSAFGAEFFIILHEEIPVSGGKGLKNTSLYRGGIAGK
jgi:hypothetical protein